MHLVAIGLGGCLGALGRYGLTRFLVRLDGPPFVTGALVANLIGCLLLGVLWTWIDGRDSVSPALRDFLSVGLLGSFTTFSTFGWEAHEFARAGQWRLAAGYVLANVVVGLAAVALGRALVRVWA